MIFSFLTYNTLFNNGLENIKPILDNYKPDILCLQEVKINEDNLNSLKKYGLELADSGYSFMRLGEMYGVATYYNPKKFQFASSSQVKKKGQIFGLIYTFFSFLLGYGQQKTFLMTDFTDLKTDKKITVCNTHLFVFGSNALRISHINHVLKTLTANSNKNFIIAGDFNYFPYQRMRLEKIMKKFKMTEATKNVSQTIKFTKDGVFESFNLFQKFSIRIVNVLFKNLKIDYIFFRGVKLKKSERVEVRYSDHYPIISEFNIR